MAEASTHNEPTLIGNHYHFADGRVLPAPRGGDESASDLPGNATPAEPVVADIPADVDYHALSLAQLRARHAEFVTEHAALIAVALEDRTVEQNRRIIALQRDAAKIAEIVTEFGTAGSVDALPNVEIPAAAASLDVETIAESAEAAGAVEGESLASLALAADHAMNGGPQASPPKPMTVPAEARRSRFMAAAAGAQSVKTGTRLETLADVGKVLQDAQAQGGSQPIRILRYGSDEKPVLSSENSAVQNTRALQEAFSSVEARTAAATCGPAEPLREVRASSHRGTPVWDSFGTPIRSSRGSFAFLASPGLTTTAVTLASTVWTDTQQDAVDPLTQSTWKAAPLAACPAIATCAAEAVPAAIKFKRLDDVTSPEYTGAVLDAVGAAQDRNVEGYILSRIDATSLLYNATDTQYGVLTQLGSKVNVVDILSRLLAAFAAANRGVPEKDNNYGVIIPAGFVSHILLDEVARLMPADEQNVADKMFASLGINKVTITPDWSIADSGGPYAAHLPLPDNATATNVGARPTNWTVRLVDYSAYFPFEVDEEEISYVPDLNDKRMNLVTYFGERWVGLCKRLTGVPTARVNFIKLYSSGTRTGGVTITEA